MSPPKKSEPTDGPGVLSNLPRTRPQRASPRRAAARKATAAAATAGNTAKQTLIKEAVKPNGRMGNANGRPPTNTVESRTPSVRKATTAAPAKAKRSRNTAKRAAGPPSHEPVPRQGFESDGERANGPVQPPGGAELVAGAAELIGELAKAGISTGERLFKDLLSRLPLS